MKLVYTNTDKPTEVKVGDIAIDFRGDQHRVKALHEPHKPSSQGHVTTDKGHFYVGVINAEWIEREDRAVCPNCDQWANSPSGDCLNQCKKRGFVSA